MDEPGALIELVESVGGISSGFSVLSAARENLRATQVMVEKLETIRLYNWDQLNNLNSFTMQTNFTEYYNYKDTNYGLTYQMALAIENTGLTETYAPQMRKITVTVNWTSLSGTPRNRSMTTFYTQNGLQAYAF